MQQPNRTSSMMAGSIPALLTASFMATLAKLAAFISLMVPPKPPMAVRQPDTITTSRILNLHVVFSNLFRKLPTSCLNIEQKA
jgi:hypothetical protein